MSAMETLIDSFNDNSTDAIKWPAAYSTSTAYSETGGVLLFTLANLTAGSNYSAYISGNVDLTGSYALMEVPKVANTATSADVFLQIDKDANNHINTVVEGTTIFFQKVVAGVKNNIATATYSATLHRWWKISESGGTVTWWTSQTGLNNSWVSQGTELVSNLFAITALQVDIGAGTFQSETNPGTAIIDNFNLPPIAKFNNRGLRPHPFSPGLAR